MSKERLLNHFRPIVNEFLLKTSCQRKQPNEYDVRVALSHGEIKTLQLDEDQEAVLIAFTTGSFPEFYIEPMLPHIGDIDVMFHSNTMLAIPREHPPPTQLPTEFHNYVKVYEIIDSHLPSYVYLELRYLLTQCTDNDNYHVIEYERGKYMENRSSRPTFAMHGPAIRTAEHEFDLVRCVRCLSWPPQAGDWPTRPRNYGWPDSATLDRVVSNGCDVVGVAHRLCRQHEWTSKLQWRLSFSRAEIVLLNSGTEVQQIVYHMLRHFMKMKSYLAVLNNYHIKTLELWACELKPRSWWTDDGNLVGICVELLHTLAKWPTYGRCQHYFISNCNLIDDSFDVTNIRSRLMSVDETWLSRWFAEKYVRKCLQLTPDRVSRLFNDVSTTTKLRSAVSAVVAWRQNDLTFAAWQALDSAEYAILLAVNSRCPTLRSCIGYLSEFAKIDSRFSVYCKAVGFLQGVWELLARGVSDKLIDALATLCGHFTFDRCNADNSTSRLWIGKAVELMTVVANKSLSTMSLIEIELSKAYLYRALKCKDSDSDSIYCLANVYLAVLCYTIGQYQTTIDHCTFVTRSDDHLHCCSHVVQGKVLPKIDDDVDNMLGLVELYQSIRTATLKQQRQTKLVSVFSTVLFAHYLRVKYLSVTDCRRLMQMSSSDVFKWYEICMRTSRQLFVADVLLFLSVSRVKIYNFKIKWRKSQHTLLNASKCATTNLVGLLEKSAVEHLTTYRQLVARDFGSVATIVTTDFEALYAYKRGDYQQCLQLSAQNVHTLLYARNVSDVSTFPEFIQLMDDGIVSLKALIIITDYPYMYKPEYSCISQLTLSLYLMTQCQLKLDHLVTSLDRTLDYIKVAQKRHPADAVLDQSILKLTKRLADMRQHYLCK